MVEELSYAEASFTYLITYYKDVFSFVVERQLQARSNLFAKSPIVVSESNSITDTNGQETKNSSTNISVESTATSSLIQTKNVGVTGFGKQILELEKEITDLESELFVNKEEPTPASSSSTLSTTTTNDSVSSSPPIVINDMKQSSAKPSTSPRKDNSPGTKERDSHTTTVFIFLFLEI
jgi:hypothetical protein